MNDSLQEALALLWQRTLRTDPSVLFGPLSARLQTRHFGDRLAQPGYVGSGYRPGGVLFVSMNPGAGGEGLGREDLQQYAALQALRGCAPAQTLERFQALNALLQGVMPTWKIFEVYVAPVLGPSGLAFADVAYLNLLKWRTLKSKNLGKLYQLSWLHHTRAQLESLRPRTVIAIGAEVGNCFERLYSGPARLKKIPRVVGCNIGKPGRAALANIVGLLQAMNPACP
jgi:hypothetical protein